MPIFILLTKLSPSILEHPQKRESIGRKWFSEVKTKCPKVKWIDHYALLGPYDFMDIYEAPSAEEAAKVSMITTAKGAVKAETWTGLPYKEFVRITKTM